MRLPLKWKYTKKSAEGNLRKRFWLRLPVWFYGTAGLLLIDEYVKEGYLFHLSDVAYIGTHENLIIVFLTLGTLSLLKDLKKEERKDE